MWDNRRYIIQGIFVLIGLVFLIKLFALQVLDKDYTAKAERNIIQPIVQYPFRGLIYDRNKELLVSLFIMNLSMTLWSFLKMFT